MSLQLQNADDQKTFHFSALQLPLVIHGVAPSTTAVHSLRTSIWVPSQSRCKTCT